MATSTNSNWITGSYVTDVQLLLEIAENNKLRIDPTLQNLGPGLDGNGSVFIGYGYDLLQNSGDAVAVLRAAGATIADPTGLTNLLNQLAAQKDEATQTQLDQVTSYIPIPNTPTAISSFAANLLQSEISVVETNLTDFLKKTLGISVPDSTDRVAC